MVKSFKHEGLAEFFTKGNSAGIQSQHKNKLRLVLGRLNASNQPQDLNLPGLQLHDLTGNRLGTWSVSVSGNWRVTFRFEDGHVESVNYEDYH